MKKDKLKIFLTGLVCFLLAFIVYLRMRSYYVANRREYFLREAGTRAWTVELSIQRNLDLLRDMKGLYDSSDFVTPEEFETFANNSLQYLSGTQALEWIPRVTAEERTRFEAEIRKKYPDFRITVKGTQGQLEKAPYKQEYYPVHYIVPYEKNKKAHGYDISSEPVSLEALNKAGKSGSMTATERIWLVQKEQGYGVLVFVPVYREGKSEKKLQGFVLSVYLIEEIVEWNQKKFGKNENDMEMFIFDLTAYKKDNNLLRSADEASGENIYDKFKKNPVYFEKIIAVADRSWSIIILPDKNLFSTKGAASLWLILFGGLLLSISVMVYLKGIFRHRFEISELNSRLNCALKESKLTEASLMRSLSFEKNIHEISSELVGVLDLDRAVNTIIEKIGRLCRASRAYLFLLSDDGKNMNKTHEWFREGAEPRKEKMKNLEIDGFPWLLRKLRLNETIHITDVHKLPEEAGAEKAMMENLNIRSLLLFPVKRRRRLSGFLGFENVEDIEDWKKEDFQILSVTSEIIGNLFERKKIEIQLLHQSKLAGIGQLAAGVAHELNNPLTAILTLSEILSKTAQERLTPQEKENLDIIKDSSLRMKKIIADLRSFSRKNHENKVLMDLNKVIENALSLIGPDLKAEMIVVEKNLNALPLLSGDNDRLIQVFINLLLNAKEALRGKKEKRIRISSRYLSEEKIREIEIEDNGSGIAPGNIHRIFEPFFSTKLSEKGLGLGLSISYEIIKTNGGNISVLSEEGQWTKIFMAFPVEDGGHYGKNTAG